MRRRRISAQRTGAERCNSPQAQESEQRHGQPPRISNQSDHGQCEARNATHAKEHKATNTLECASDFLRNTVNSSLSLRAEASYMERIQALEKESMYNEHTVFAGRRRSPPSSRRTKLRQWPQANACYLRPVGYADNDESAESASNPSCPLNNIVDQFHGCLASVNNAPPCTMGVCMRRPAQAQ